MSAIIGNKIRTLRQKNGMTQEDLGVIMGVTKASVQKYETGQVKLTNDKIRILSDFFKVFPRHFVYEVPEDFFISFLGEDYSAYIGAELSVLENLDLSFEAIMGESSLLQFIAMAKRLNSDGQIKLHEFGRLLATHDDYKKGP